MYVCTGREMQFFGKHSISYSQNIHEVLGSTNTNNTTTTMTQVEEEDEEGVVATSLLSWYNILYTFSCVLENT